MEKKDLRVFPGGDRWYGMGVGGMVGYARPTAALSSIRAFHLFSKLKRMEGTKALVLKQE